MTFDDKQQQEEGVRPQAQAQEQELPFFTQPDEPQPAPTVVEQDLFGSVHVEALAQDNDWGKMPSGQTMPVKEAEENPVRKTGGKAGHKREKAGHKEPQSEPKEEKAEHKVKPTEHNVKKTRSQKPSVPAAEEKKHPFRGRPMKRQRVDKEELPGTKKYLSKINADTLETITLGVIDQLMMKKGYKDKTCSARQLAVLLHTNTRYISIAISRKFHVNYSQLVNKLRVEEAMSMLVDARYKHYRMEDISDTVGFANRQTFNAAFLKHCGMTPSEYVAKVK